MCVEYHQFYPKATIATAATSPMTAARWLKRFASAELSAVCRGHVEGDERPDRLWRGGDACLMVAVERNRTCPQRAAARGIGESRVAAEKAPGRRSGEAGGDRAPKEGPPRKATRRTPSVAPSLHPSLRVADRPSVMVSLPRRACLEAASLPSRVPPGRSLRLPGQRPSSLPGGWTPGWPLTPLEERVDKRLVGLILLVMTLGLHGIPGQSGTVTLGHDGVARDSGRGRCAAARGSGESAGPVGF